MGMHAVIIGDPADGFELVGPFATEDEAYDWLDDQENPGWVLPLLSSED